MFDTQPKLELHKDIVDYFIKQKLLIPFIKNHSYEANNYLVKNCTGLSISWKTNGQQFALESEHLFGERFTECIIHITKLDDNVDQVKFIVGTDLYYKYCLKLDYEKNEIGFAIADILI